MLHAPARVTNAGWRLNAGTLIVPAVCLAVFLPLTGLLCFGNLDGGSFLTDELAYVSSAREYITGHYTLTLEHPFLGKWLIAAALALFGVSDASARLPSALCGALTAGVALVWGWRLGGPRRGLAAGLLMLANPFFRSVTRQALLDAPLLLFFTIALALFWCWLQSGRPGWLLAAAAATGLAAGSKLTALVLLPIFALAFGGQLLRERRFPAAGTVVLLGAGTLLALAVFLLTYGPAFTELPRIFGEMVRVWTEEQAAGHRIRLAGQVFDQPPWWAYLYWLVEEGFPGILLLLSVTAGIMLSGSSRSRDRGYLLLALAVPFLFLSWGLSFKMYRYGAVLAPGMALLGSLVVQLPETAVWLLAGAWGQRARRALSAGLLAGVLALLLPPAVATTRLGATEYKAAGMLLAATPQPLVTPGGAPLLLVWGYTDAAAWYLGGRYQIVGGYTTEAFQDLYSRAAVVLVDPRMSGRYPADPLLFYLRMHQSKFTLLDVPGVELYQRVRDGQP